VWLRLGEWWPWSCFGSLSDLMVLVGFRWSGYRISNIKEPFFGSVGKQDTIAICLTPFFFF
jgi:hypothetical protein